MTTQGEEEDTDGMNIDIPFQFVKKLSHIDTSAISAVSCLRIWSGTCACKRKKQAARYERPPLRDDPHGEIKHVKQRLSYLIVHPRVRVKVSNSHGLLLETNVNLVAK